MTQFYRLRLLAACLCIIGSQVAGLQSPNERGAQIVLGFTESPHTSSPTILPTTYTRKIEEHDWSDLADYIKSFIEEWHITGLSVAVKDSKRNISWAEGFGYADRSTLEPMTPHHMTFTGSTTKSFTAAALSLLVDNSTNYQGLNWTTPISSILPNDFVLSNPWATQHINIRDALTHRTGLPGHDLAWVPTTRDLVRGLRYLPFSVEPREMFQYSNKMYGVLGYLLEKLTGSTVGEIFHKYLWQPMGMNETFFGLPDALASGAPLAKCYHWSETLGEHVLVPYERNPADSAAGDVVSNVLDYTTYLQTLMAGEGGPVSAAGLAEIKRPRILAKHLQPPFTGPVFYSLGWYTASFRGERAWWHTGQTADFLSIMIMVPSRRISVVVLINQGQPAFEAVAYRVLYDIFEVPKEERIDFDALMKERAQEKKETVRNCPKQTYHSTPSEPIAPALPLERYSGTYRESGYGNITLALDCDSAMSFTHPAGPSTTKENEKKCNLKLTRRDDAYPHINVDLVHHTEEHWLGWIWYGEWQDPQNPLTCVRAEFRVGPDGEVAQFGIDFRLNGAATPLVWYDRVTA